MKTVKGLFIEDEVRGHVDTYWQTIHPSQV